MKSSDRMNAGLCRMRARVVILTALLAALLALFCIPAAQAAEVRVFHPNEEGMNPSRQRQSTLELGFEEAVHQAALGLLPGTLTEERAALLRERLSPSADKYVLGYKEIAVTPSGGGLNMVLDVDVDRRALRETLERLGLFQTLNEPLGATLITEATLTSDDLAALGKMQTLTGVFPSAVPLLEFSIGREAKGKVRGVLHSPVGSWSAMDADVGAVWTQVWGNYFSRIAKESLGEQAQVLSVAGWFTPDGAAEFDNVLRGWDGVLRDVRLIDMDLATEGVSARWEMGVLDRAALLTRLEGYLPSRGLNYRLSGGAE